MITDDLDEMFVVVDRGDNIIGPRTRRECHSDSSLIHRAVSVIIKNSEGKILLQKRSMTKDSYPGYYTTSASGHVAWGTSYEETAQRELMEEIGISTDLTYAGKYYIQDARESEFDSIYTGVYDGPFKINKHEVDSVMYFSVEEIIRIKNRLTTSAQRALKEVGIL